MFYHSNGKQTKMVLLHCRGDFVSVIILDSLLAQYNQKRPWEVEQLREEE